jgi:hypothetical protein
VPFCCAFSRLVFLLSSFVLYQARGNQAQDIERKIANRSSLASAKLEAVFISFGRASDEPLRPVEELGERNNNESK